VLDGSFSCVLYPFFPQAVVVLEITRQNSEC
jgi:hypothetical protein